MVHEARQVLRSCLLVTLTSSWAKGYLHEHHRPNGPGRRRVSLDLRQQLLEGRQPQRAATQALANVYRHDNFLSLEIKK